MNEILFTVIRSLTFITNEKNNSTRSVKHKRAIFSGTDSTNSIAVTQGNNSNSQEESSFEKFVNVPWKIYKCSPLYKFSHEEEALKEYSRCFEQQLHMSKLSNNLDNLKFAVSLTCIKNLKCLECDADPIYVSVKSLIKQKSKVRVKHLFSCILANVRENEDVGLTVPKNFVYLPLIFLNGSKLLTEKWISFMQINFDACITQVVLSSVALEWMAALSNGYFHNSIRSSQPYKFLYVTPDCVDGIEQITLKIDFTSNKHLWQSIQNNEKIVLDSEVKKYMEKIKKMFYHNFKMKLKDCSLKEITTPIADVKSTGEIKVFEPNAFPTICKFLISDVLNFTL